MLYTTRKSRTTSSSERKHRSLSTSSYQYKDQLLGGQIKDRTTLTDPALNQTGIVNTDMVLEALW